MVIYTVILLPSSLWLQKHDSNTITMDTVIDFRPLPWLCTTVVTIGTTCTYTIDLTYVHKMSPHCVFFIGLVYYVTLFYCKYFRFSTNFSYFHIILILCGWSSMAWLFYTIFYCFMFMVQSNRHWLLNTAADHDFSIFFQKYNVNFQFLLNPIFLQP